MGIQDILLELEWVQDNIAASGGHGEKLQIFGQSAGSYNTYSIVSLPQVPSLINAAICESSGGRSVQTNSSMQALGAAYAKTLGCFDTDVQVDR
ncbi:hypothetical protein EG329_000613 [Mollisiaceae sp. DMI_Dod_QoI]|nr:hypothetical protein EG329_000613 [Helotiales sp. DMI_Dod_QoI]